LKKFLKGEKAKNFLCVGIKRDGLDIIIISERPTQKNEALKIAGNGEILYIKSIRKQSSTALEPSLNFTFDSGRSSF
jgi:hypothetical protein